MGRYRGPKVKLFLAAIYKEAKGSSVRAAEIAGYKDPVLSGPRLRRRYSDLVEQARLAWAETAHMSVDEALERVANVGRDKEHKDHVRALNMVLELHGAHTSHDPAQLRREVTELIKQIATRRTLTSATTPLNGAVVDVQVVDTVPNADATSAVTADHKR